MNKPQRIIGTVSGEQPGPCIILIGGMHGNEPTGIDSVRQVLGTLQEGCFPLRGNLHAFRGNLPALAAGKRYLEKDLNRIWKQEWIERLRRDGSAMQASVEDREMLELLAIIDEAIAAARGDVLVMDLHTSSAAGAPFIVQADNHLTGKVTERLHAPAVIDTPGFFHGALLTYMRLRGHAAMVFEGGQHGTKESIRVHVAAVWLAMAAVGALREDELPANGKCCRALTGSTNGMPKTLELTYRYAIHPGDCFTMLPGFRNFDKVHKNQLVGHDNNGEVLSPQEGRIFLPLYQDIGEDGFFLVRDAIPKRSTAG